MTELGLKNYEQIIIHTFEYLAMLTASPPLAAIYAECEQINNITFNFLEKENPSGYTSSLASMSYSDFLTLGDMHDYAPDDILKGHYIMNDFDPILIHTCSDYFKPDNMIVILQSTGQDDSIEWKKSRWYETPFVEQVISDTFIKTLRATRPSSAFHIPDINSFIPENFNVVEKVKTLKRFPSPWIVS